jgi:hypothetical protein
MLQDGMDFDLASEPLSQIGGASKVRQQDLHGFYSVGDRVLHSIHRPHSANPQQVDNSVVPNCFAYIQSPCRSTSYRNQPGNRAGPSSA